jgi:hypothetical protein
MAEGADMDKPQVEPLLSFYRLLTAAPLPRRADKAAGGYLPLRALRYCEPVTTACSLGWWLFPPMGFSLMWDGGTGMFWTPEGADSWYPLRHAQFPNFAEEFARLAPSDIAEFAPPMLAAPNEPGIVQIWTGWLVRTKLGWSSFIRSPANFPKHQGLEPFEGVVETDHWFGPLFISVRLTKTDIPIMIKPEAPLLQVTPIFREHYAERTLSDARVCAEASDWTEREWEGFRKTVVAPQLLEQRQPGLHAVSIRRRRKHGDDQ